jgi:CNT family concentrative nucleoside transporter
MVAYFKFPSVEHTMSPRSKMIATYALCGFSNPASIGITIASLGGMAPERRPDVVAVVLRAFIAGSLTASTDLPADR